MKLDINKIKLTPKNMKFGFAVYGPVSQEIEDWVKFHNLEKVTTGPYTNIHPDILTNVKMTDLFEAPVVYEYGDFFSPNLNKDLHLGHLSNLVVAKALQSLGIAKRTIAILGDTLEGEVSKEEALEKYNMYCDRFGYRRDDLFFASAQHLEITALEDGVGEWEGTKVFTVGEDKVVGLKSTGASSYFYQDVALAKHLNAPTLYITGLEQNFHFYQLQILFPHIKHIGLGLVTVDGKKMSSRTGNVIMMDEVLDAIMLEFNNDSKLSWNVLCGHILKYDLPSMKDIKMSQIKNVKSSSGLYLSYTLARLKSADMKANDITEFGQWSLQFKLLKARTLVSPHILLDGLVELANDINHLYKTHRIKDNIENQKIYQPFMDDLLLGMKLLGMFEVDKV